MDSPGDIPGAGDAATRQGLPTPGDRVMVALSGGVDSAVAALLLKEQGFRVEALHMTNWEDADAHCTAGQDLADARQVAADLDLPLHHVNFSRQYRDQVFAAFLADYRAGLTPNPDVACNRHIKFGALHHHARRLGARWVATGHYARVAHAPGPRLLAARDADKDQTYFLHAIAPEALARTLFPLGDLTKAEVRARATAAGLANHAKRDSTGICFIGERPFREFLRQYLPDRPGPVVDAEGHELGTHPGLHHFTLGQRHGFGIGGRAGGSGAWYVAEKDDARNALVVVQGRDHPLLRSTGLVAGDLHWLGPAPDLGSPFPCLVRTRYRQQGRPCRLQSGADGTLEVEFGEPEWAVTPGQYAVFYRDQVCLGGGRIRRRLPLAVMPGAATA